MTKDRLAPATLSRELREGRSPDLSRRHWTIGQASPAA
jgi:hypothetical protein